MYKRGPRTLDDLERFCKEEWSQIPFSVFYNLIRYYGSCFIGKGRLYKVLFAGVPIIGQHMVLIKNIFFNKGFHFGFFSFL